MKTATNTAIKSAVLGCTLLCSLPSPAATQGTLGATSTGTLNISATLQDLVIISGLADIALGTYSGTGNMTGQSTFCVYRNGTGNYSATLTGDGPGFLIKSGANTLAYTATFTHGATPVAATSGTVMGTALAPLSGNSTSQTCGGGTNGNISISISQAAAQAAPSGAYTGTLTVLIAPL
jgi:hypothetical protein